MSFICSVCCRAAFICCFPLCIISVSCKFASVRVCFCQASASELLPNYTFLSILSFSVNLRARVCVCTRACACVCVLLWGWEVLDAYFVSTNYPATVPTNCQGLHASDVFKYPAAGGTKQVTGWALKLRTRTHARAHMHTHTVNSSIIGSSLPPATSAPYPHDVFVAGC